jgi:hypothetical protein
MGTSLAMIDQAYGRLAPDAEEQERLLLDAYETRAASGWRGSGQSAVSYLGFALGQASR